MVGLRRVGMRVFLVCVGGGRGLSLVLVGFVGFAAGGGGDR